MVQNREINALFQLIDDPDQEVFDTVTNRIISIGRAIIPNLESLWETTEEKRIQERIELIIHQLHFKDLVGEFTIWKDSPTDLLQGALLFCKYTYPELNTAFCLQEIEKIRRNIWLELNSYLTPLEQTGILSGILYNYYNITGNEVNPVAPKEYLLNELLQTKKGNSIAIGLLYQIMCNLLDIPVRVIHIPRQFILAYFETEVNFFGHPKPDTEKIAFYVDPLSGQVYSQQDVENYFKKIGVPAVPSYFKKMDHPQIISFLLHEYAKCFSSPENQYKKDDLLTLASLLDN